VKQAYVWVNAHLPGNITAESLSLQQTAREVVEQVKSALAVPLNPGQHPGYKGDRTVADAAVPAGERVFAAGLVHSCLCPLSLPPSSRVARRCPPCFRPFGGAEAEAPLG
jgi:hypothetical protein